MWEIYGVGGVWRNGNVDGFVADIVIVDVVVTLHGAPLLAVFVVVQRSESKLITNYKNHM